MNAVVTIYNDEQGKPFSASTLLQTLRLSNPVWWDSGDQYSNWVFRGQSDANWRLIPSAWRSEEEGNPLHTLIAELDKLPLAQVITPEMKLSNINAVDSAHPIYSWINAELESLYQFAELGNRLGLDVELVDWSPRKLKYRFSGGLLFAPDQPNIALAQHHGVPTRYLDFSMDPVLAAYHAVNSLNSNSEKRDIAVWAVNRAIKAVFAVPPKHNIGYGTLNFVETAAHRNPFLHAQSGLFLKFDYAEQYFYHYKRWPDLESLLSETNQEDFTSNVPVVRKYVLKSDYISELREMLRREGFSKPKLMPTLDNVAFEIVQNWRS